MRIANDWWRSKTTWISITGILAAIAGKLAGQLDWAQMGSAIWAALTASAIRDTIATTGTAIRDTMASTRQRDR